MAERKQLKRRKNHIRIAQPAERRLVASRPSNLAEMVLSKRLRSAMAFALLCIALYVIIRALPPSLTKPVNENTAWTLGIILNAFGMTVSTAHDTVSQGELAFRIIPECTPIFTACLFLSFIAFYPATLREKLTGLITGVPALYLGNLARLAATFLISSYNRRLFEVVHLYLGQVFTILLVLTVCIAWLKSLDQEKTKNSTLEKATSFFARFTLISCGLFLVWIHIHHWYIRLLDEVMLFGFSLFDYRFALARHIVYYYETFSIVCYSSLVFSALSLQPAIKVRALAAGLGLLFLTHLFHRIDNALMAYFRLNALLPLDLTLLVIGQYVLPMLFLIFLVCHQNRGSLKTASE